MVGLADSGLNAPISANSSNQVYPGITNGNISLEGQLSAGGSDATLIFNLRVVDKAVIRARTLTPVIRPMKKGGQSYYWMGITPEQHYDLRRTSTTQEYADLQRALLEGSQPIVENRLFAGGTFVGMYNRKGCFIEKSVSNNFTELLGLLILYIIMYNIRMRQSAAK